MAMNALIPLMGTSPDIAGSYGRGMDVRQQGIENDRRNALAAMLQQQGPGIMAGDQNALAALAGYDPQMAVGIQSQQLGQKATRQNMQIDQQKLKLAMEAGQRAAQEHGARMSAFEREQAAAETAGLVEGLAYAWKAGPEEWARAAPTLFGQAGHNGDVPGYEDAPYVLMHLGATAEAFKAEAPDPVVVAPGSSIVDKNNPGGGAMFTAPRETKPGFRDATPEELARYGAAAGQVGPDERFYPIDPPRGMSIETTPGGGFRFVQGPGAGEKPAGLPQLDTSGMLATVDGILNDKALDWATGWFEWTQNIPGTQSKRFQGRTKQLDGQAFLQAFDRLRGAGQITEIEGKKATDAIGRLDTAQRPEDYREALTELQSILTAVQRRDKGLPPNDPPMPEGIEPDLWGVMTPEERALWAN